MPFNLTEPLAIGLVAGLFSLLGAFAGAFLARRSDYIKWLRQNRSETFAEFFTKLFEAQHKAFNVLHDPNLDPHQRDIQVTEIYSAPRNHARLVRLYLPKSCRDEFSTLVGEIAALHSQMSLGDSRLTTMEKKIERIQAIFEEATAG